MPVNHGPVHAIRLAPPELILQKLLRPRVLGEHDEARRVAIDPVHDERPPLPVRPQVILEVVVHGIRVGLSLERNRESPGGLFTTNSAASSYTMRRPPISVGLRCRFALPGRSSKGGRRRRSPAASPPE